MLYHDPIRMRGSVYIDVQTVDKYPYIVLELKPNAIPSNVWSMHRTQAEELVIALQAAIDRTKLD